MDDWMHELVNENKRLNIKSMVRMGTLASKRCVGG